MRAQRIIYVLLILAFWSCREDFERNEAEKIPFAPALLEDYATSEDIVNSSLVGFVQDDNQNPIADALVTLNGIPTTTDIYGHFFYTDHPMNKEGTTVEIQAANYHKHSKLFYPSEGAKEQLDFILTEIEDDSEFNGSFSGSIALDENILLEYSEEAFLTSTGNTYLGMVNVLSTFSEKNDNQFAVKAPGNFQAVSIENRLVGLKPQSLLQIAFLDESGNELLINQEAEVFAQIPNANTSMEAWYYVPSFGLYTVNTETEVDDTTLRVNLSHNNFILLADSYESELSTIQLTAADGSGMLEDIQAEWKTQDGVTHQSVISNNLGLVKLITPMVPEGILTLKDACGNEVYNEALIAVNNDISLENVSIKSLEGDLYDCDVQAIDDGVIAVRQGSEIRYHYISNSTFTLSLQVCNNGEASAQGLDGVSLGQNQATDINLEMQDNLGDLFTCDEPLVNMLHLINVTTGQEIFYPIQAVSGNTASLTAIEDINNVQGIKIQFSFSGNQIGDYSASDAHEVSALEDATGGFNFAGDAESFIVSRFGELNKLTIGSFEGTFEDNDRQVFEELRGSFNLYLEN